MYQINVVERTYKVAENGNILVKHLKIALKKQYFY